MPNTAPCPLPPPPISGEVPDPAARPWFKRWWGILLMVSAAFVLVGILLGTTDDSGDGDLAVDGAAEDVANEPDPEPEPEPDPEPEPEPAPEPGPELTAGQSNALRAAENYLNFTAFSRTGLIEQLEFEGYTREQAEYGVTQAGL